MDGKGIDGAVMEDHPIPSVLKAAKKTALDKVREMIIREQIKYQGYQAETISDPAIDQSTAAKEVITLAEKIFLQDVCFADLLGAIDDLRGMIGLHRPGGPGEQVAKLIRYIFKVRGTEGHMLHFLGVGEPGVGKTTFFRHLAAVMRALGVLKAPEPDPASTTRQRKGKCHSASASLSSAEEVTTDKMLATLDQRCRTASTVLRALKRGDEIKPEWLDILRRGGNILTDTNRLDHHDHLHHSDQGGDDSADEDYMDVDSTSNSGSDDDDDDGDDGSDGEGSDSEMIYREAVARERRRDALLMSQSITSTLAMVGDAEARVRDAQRFLQQERFLPYPPLSHRQTLLGNKGGFGAAGSSQRQCDVSIDGAWHCYCGQGPCKFVVLHDTLSEGQARLRAATASLHALNTFAQSEAGSGDSDDSDNPDDADDDDVGDEVDDEADEINGGAEDNRDADDDANAGDQDGDDQDDHDEQDRARGDADQGKGRTHGDADQGNGHADGNAKRIALSGAKTALVALQKKPAVIVVSREHLVSGFQGQSAPKTREVIEAAKGGMLVIDEAHQVLLDDKDTFGTEVAGVLVMAMSAEAMDLSIALVGHRDLLNKMFTLLKGLRRRLRVIEFPTYNAEDLALIFRAIMRRMGGWTVAVPDVSLAKWFDARRERFPDSAGDVEQLCLNVKIAHASKDDDDLDHHDGDHYDFDRDDRDNPLHPRDHESSSASPLSSRVPDEEPKFAITVKDLEEGYTAYLAASAHSTGSDNGRMSKDVQFSLFS